MATVLLSAVGSAVGGSLGGTVLGMSAATLGQAAGGIAGAVLDQAILGGGAQAVDVGRARSLRIQSSTEGQPIPQTFGRTRLAGQLIWSTRFRENIRNTSQGSKGAPSQRVREFSYTISFAVALCEGPIDRVGRIWADGKLLDTSALTYRVYRGDEDQLPDPKIEAVEGAAPAYRGTAYVVFEDLGLGPFGNRIPQLNFEVYRAPAVVATGAQAGTRLPDLVRGVALSPGTGEFALDPEPARIAFPAGGGRFANINNAAGVPDIIHALDQLGADLPLVDTVSLVVSWFGDDLRAGECRVRPRVEEPGRAYSPEPWSVAGLTTSTAQPVSLDTDGRPNFGGAPSDASILRALGELTTRGKKVVFYPFLLMDIVAGNGLPDPHGGAEQAVFPWRGRITVTADQDPSAVAEVAAFFGTVTASDFAVTPGAISYTGPDEWTWRRFVLHQAALCAAAGGVHAFCIGSELRGLTTARSSRTAFPAVDQLIALAAEVRALLPDALITYAADWSEYFGHQPQDGTGDVLFHLDPLWADGNIDLVGIDDYTPLSDWRHASSHADAGAGTVYALDYLSGNVEGGEHYDFFYATEADRASQLRSPIVDGAHGEGFVFRPKDIRGWWQNPHHNRVDGVRQATPTPWVPESKPVWLTETGCPAVDLGANQPNVFYDSKSSESALPPGSRGARDDEMQRRFLQAKLGYWADNTPVSSVYGGPMIPPEGVLVWTWDARPWPDFPVRESIWADGPSHRLGHWISGRVTAGALAEVVTEICLAAGLVPEDIDTDGLFGTVDGYVIERTGSAREALQPLMQAYGFDAFESGGRVVFASRQGAVGAPLDPSRLLPGEGEDGAPVMRTKSRLTETADAVRFSYVQAEADYRVGTAEARLPGGPLTRVSETSLGLSLPGSLAQAIAERWLAEQVRAQERATFTLPPSALAFEPGDVVQFAGTGQVEQYRIDRITDAGSRQVEAVRIEPALYLPTAAPERRVEPLASQPPGPVTAILMDLAVGDHRPHLAVTAEPWPGEIAVYRSATTDGFALIGTVAKPALIGHLLKPLPVGQPNRWHRVAVDVALPGGSVQSAERLAVLNGANRLAIELPSGEWEMAQFEGAALSGPDRHRLVRLLRGQAGTEAFLAPVPAGARIVVLDDAVVPMALDEAERGLARKWRIGPASAPPSANSYVELNFTALGNGLRPLAPAHLRARPAGAELAVTWIRRTRVGGDAWIGIDVPLGEERESYRLRVLRDGAVLRVVETAQPAFTYTAAMQAEDGPGVTLAVAQLSTTYGYGPERMIDV